MSSLNAMKSDAISYLVIGAGISGWSAFNFLHAKQECVRVMDNRLQPPYAQQLKEKLAASEVCLGSYNEQWTLESDIIVLSPGVSPQLPIIQNAIKAGIEVIGDVELFARHCNKPYLAITGSNGKSTVTTLATSILNSQGVNAIAGGNIGKPSLDLLDTDAAIYVLELSSFQLETCPSLKPVIAVVLNISDDHMDRHNSLEEYARIKMSIYQQADNHVYARHQNNINPNIQINNKSCVSFGLDEPGQNDFGVIEFEAERWLAHGDNKIIRAAELSLPGAIGELNTLAALSLTYSYIKDMTSVVELLQQFAGLPYRCQLVSTKGNVHWINDSKGTNIGATIAAIESVARAVVLILGGVHKGGSIAALDKAIQTHVKTVIVFGRDKDIFKDALSSVEVVSVDSLESAVQAAAMYAISGEAVLFSPACASFDMFENYQARGEAFNQAVSELSVRDQNES